MPTLYKQKQELACQKDSFCEKTVEYFESISQEEYLKYKYKKRYEGAQTEINLKDNQIDEISKILSEKIKEKFNEIKKDREIQLLQRKVDDLLEFKKRFETYEPLLKDIEKEIKIAEEIDSEISRMEKGTVKKGQIDDVENFIKENLPLTEEDYKHITSDQ